MGHGSTDFTAEIRNVFVGIKLVACEDASHDDEISGWCSVKMFPDGEKVKKYEN